MYAKTRKVRRKDSGGHSVAKAPSSVAKAPGGSTVVAKAPGPLYKDAYAITLQDEFPLRFTRMKTFANVAGVPLQPWKGVKLTPQDKPTLPPQGVGTTHYEDRTRTTFNLGVIGAFLAHRALLTHLAELPPTPSFAPQAQGTLIFEDDVEIPPDFNKRLEEIQKELPADWDILFLDKYRVEGRQISPHLMRLDRDMTAMKNWGMWAFIVKNSSIKDRILPTMEHMIDVPDIQLNKFAHKLNFYLIQPGIVRPDPITAPVSVVTHLDKQK